MKLFSAQHMHSVDQETILAGETGLELMTRAVRKLAGELLFFAEGRQIPLCVFVGPGNNGGDGLGLACELAQRGWMVELRLCVAAEKIKGDALHFLTQAQSLGLPIHDFSKEDAWKRPERFLSSGTWLVDALLGTGSAGIPRGSVGRAITFLQQQQPRHLIWAVDLPSGLDPDEGKPFDPALCVTADYTLCLGGPKRGMVASEAVNWCGSISVLDLGFDDELLLQKSEGPHQVLSDKEAASLIPRLHRGAHKGSKGHALLVGGSLGMTGAISLSAKAALRSGCGLVSVMTPAGVAGIVDAAVPEALVNVGKQGRFGSLCAQDIPFVNYDAVGVGPGLRLNLDSRELLLRILKENMAPLVLDADALNVLATFSEEERPCEAELWVTPHPGEMARLLNVSVAEVEKDRYHSAEQCSTLFGAHVLLKGAGSICRDREGELWVNVNGNPGMATGGAGDVLTGILTGLLAQGVDHHMALPLAVYLHGRAGDLAAQRKGILGMLAGDIVDALPEVMRQLQGR
ncbi:NAD(P)H-hydrate dehydratase [Kiritimatiellota bacterium B12222]|nr:NAD(P)H-hydrate dehydratase [Kiritimatiellota bacterium B12222]